MKEVEIKVIASLDEDNEIDSVHLEAENTAFYTIIAGLSTALLMVAREQDISFQELILFLAEIKGGIDELPMETKVISEDEEENQ